jgi:asparagine synthase (glutamine-hydrolysing)
MFRYVAAVWQSQEDAIPARRALQRLRENAPPWVSVFETRGLSVLSRSGQQSLGDVLEIGSSGVVLGTLFTAVTDSSSQCARVTFVSEPEAKQIVQTNGRSLTKSNWGSYVLFLRNPVNGKTTVFRGPASRLPCFRVAVGGVTFFFSAIEDLLSLGVMRPSMNIPQLCAQALQGDYINHSTALEAVSNVLPGEAVEPSTDGIKQLVYWSPQLLACDDTVANIADAARLLRSNARACVDTWSTLHSSILVTVSGGVDSSVVFGLLGEATHRPEVVGLNFYDKAAADERTFARSMARKVGLELVEREMNPLADFRAFLSGGLTAYPGLSMTAFEYEPACISVARQKGATAIFTGELGDDVFGRALGPELVADNWRQHGLSAALLRVVWDYAEFKRMSLWKALSAGLRYHSMVTANQCWSMYTYQREVAGIGDAHRLVTQDVIAEYERTHANFLHPWLANVDRVPLSWFHLVYGLIMTTSAWAHTTFGDGDDSIFVHPLASQPLIEVYARIPSALHVSSGQSGTVAREAFSSVLSNEVLNRGRSKGTPEIWLIQTVDRNRQFLREYLLDGMLVREGILDAKKLDSVVSGNLGNSQVSVSDLIIQLYIESWMRRWHALERRAVA